MGKTIRSTRILGTLMVFVGACLLIAFVWQTIGPSVSADRRQKALRREFFDVPTVGPSRAERARALESHPPHPKPLGASGPKPIGRLIGRSIGVDQMIVEGVSLARLAYGPGRYPDSAPFGTLGTSAIAGHRTGWGAPLEHLDRLRPGDEIIVETPRSAFVYSVTGTKVVGPTDTWVLSGDPRSTAKSKLTLTTCTPKYTSKDRLIVWADLVRARSR